MRLVQLGAILRVARKEAGLTQKQAGLALGFQGQAGYRRWEAGEVSPPISKLMDAAALFSTSLTALVRELTPASPSRSVAEESTLFLLVEEEQLVRQYRSAPTLIRRKVLALLGG